MTKVKSLHHILLWLFAWLYPDNVSLQKEISRLMVNEWKKKIHDLYGDGLTQEQHDIEMFKLAAEWVVEKLEAKISKG